MQNISYNVIEKCNDKKHKLWSKASVLNYRKYFTTNDFHLNVVWKICYIYIHYSYRGKNFGSKLLVFLSANQNQYRIFGKPGFEITKFIYKSNQTLARAVSLESESL
jgi:hypothetical protein